MALLLKLASISRVSGLALPVHADCSLLGLGEDCRMFAPETQTAILSGRCGNVRARAQAVCVSLDCPAWGNDRGRDMRERGVRHRGKGHKSMRPRRCEVRVRTMEQDR